MRITFNAIGGAVDSTRPGPQAPKPDRLARSALSPEPAAFFCSRALQCCPAESLVRTQPLRRRRLLQPDAGPGLPVHDYTASAFRP